MRTWILQRYRDYARWYLLAGLFLAPVIFLQTTADVFNLTKLTVLWAFGVGALALFLVWSAERGVWPPLPRLALPAAAFLAACTLATVLSQNPRLSLVGLYHRYGGLVPFLLYAAIAAVILGVYWERPGDLRAIARAAAYASMLVAAYVLIQKAGLDWINWKDASGKPPQFPVGTMGNSNFAGGYLGITAPLFLAVALTTRRELWRTILSAALGLDLLALWFTQTRGGMIAAAAGLATVALVLRDRMPRWARRGAAAGLAAGMVVAALVVWHPGAEAPPKPLAGIETFRTGTLEIRRFYWGAAWRVFLDHPILGTGLETYYAVYPRYRAPEDGARFGLVITDKPHNIYLEYAANAGILGAGTYLALVGAGLWFGYRHARRLEGAQGVLAACFVGTLAGYLAQGVFSIDVPPLAVMGWVALGGIAAMADPKVVEARERREAAARAPKGKGRRKKRPPAEAAAGLVARQGPTRWPVHAPVLAVAAALVIAGFRPMSADVKAKSAQLKDLGGRPMEAVLAEYDAAVRLFPLEATYRSAAGAVAERRVRSASDNDQRRLLLAQSLDRYRDALRMQPGNVFFLMNPARVTTTWAETVDPARFPEADRLWQRVVARDPTDWEVRQRYASMLSSWASASKDAAVGRRAAEQLAVVTRMRPGYTAAWVDLGRAYKTLGEEASARAALERALAIEPANTQARALLSSLPAG